MTYRGHIKNGVIVLDTPAKIPEGAEVEVRTSDQGSLPPSWTLPDDSSLICGSVVAATESLPPEDFSDWEK